MELKPQLFMAKVMHKRFFPRINAFTYGVYYLSLPLSVLDKLPRTFIFNIDGPALFSFYRKDYGARDGSDLHVWVKRLFAQHGHALDGCEVILITMPRICGYAFNPVSFWMAYDQNGNIRAVLAEVNNTFGETHSYLCANQGMHPITQHQWMKAEKFFHVSPFLERKGEYAFRFHDAGKTLGLWIDYFHENGEKQLATSLTGHRVTLTNSALIKAFLAIPFVTLKTILLIHWQALILFFKKIRYINKPPQLATRHSHSKDNLTNL